MVCPNEKNVFLAIFERIFEEMLITWRWSERRAASLLAQFQFKMLGSLFFFSRFKFVHWEVCPSATLARHYVQHVTTSLRIVPVLGWIFLVAKKQCFSTHSNVTILLFFCYYIYYKYFVVCEKLWKKNLPGGRWRCATIYKSLTGKLMKSVAGGLCPHWRGGFQRSCCSGLN